MDRAFGLLELASLLILSVRLTISFLFLIGCFLSFRHILRKILTLQRSEQMHPCMDCHSNARQPWYNYEVVQEGQYRSLGAFQGEQPLQSRIVPAAATPVAQFFDWAGGLL
jgi:hypothetical protein